MTVIRRTVSLKAGDLMPPSLRSRLLADGARAGRDKLIADGSAPPAYRTFVDEREGADENSVRPDGAIIYRFNLLAEAVIAALAFVITRSPAESGQFKRSWFVLVDRARHNGDLRDIAAGAEVMITNNQPYARKIEVGAMRMSVPPKIVEQARQFILRKFPVIRASKQFVYLDPGYTLRGRHSKRRGARKDTARGQRLQYPALVLRARV